MTSFKTLTFTQLPKLTAADPVINRRNKLIGRLKNQIALCNDQNFTLTRQKWVADEHGVKQLRELRKRVPKWWLTDATGAVVLTVRYGSKKIEFSPGKAAIAVGKAEKLIPTIESLIEIVEAGELDELISAQIKKSSTQFVKGKREA